MTPALRKVAEALTTEYGWASSVANDAIIQAAVEAKALRLGVAPDDYAQLVTANQSELLALVEEVSFNPTAFFAPAESFAFLRTRVLPQLLATCEEGRGLRVWSAATATGEEAYSLAIMLEQLAPPVSADIFATDVRNRALLTASAAQYPRTVIGSLDADIQSEFFVPMGSDKVMVAQRARRLVSFRRVNLTERLFWRGVQQKFDLIVCANLMGMLSGMAVRALAGNLSQALRTGGVLMIAPNESSLIHSSRLTALPDAPGFYLKA